MEALLTAEQAGELLQIHPRTVKKLAGEGRIPGMRIGKLWRFRRSSLDSWIQSELDSQSRLCPEMDNQ